MLIDDAGRFSLSTKPTNNTQVEPFRADLPLVTPTHQRTPLPEACLLHESFVRVKGMPGEGNAGRSAPAKYESS